MIVVMQCAASKHPNAGTFRDKNARKVLFVANPAWAPASDEFRYARPDDPAHDGRSWREHLTAYNQNGDNPYSLLRAFELYENRAYRDLVAKFGLEKVYILSAGWGLISADFLTPLYDITFSTAVRRDGPWKLRKRTDRYDDYNHLPKNTADEVIYLGGKDYIPLFESLTRGIPGARRIFYNSETPPRAAGCNFERFVTRTKTNWHYECARWLLSQE